MARVNIDELQSILIQIGMVHGLSETDATTVACEYLDAEMRGIKTHGIFRYTLIEQAIKNRLGKPQIIQETAFGALVDGQRELGPLAARCCIDLLIRKVRHNGMGIVALRNVSRYGRLAPYGAIIAETGLIGLIMNSAGPSNVAPYGSYRPVLGTNPLCIAVPNADSEPIVIDFATSESVWSERFLAEIEQRDLPVEAFYKADGSYAVRPADAHAIRTFGGAKGYALSLAIELLVGAFAGTKMGPGIQTEFDLGYVFLALDPAMFRDSADEFFTEAAALAAHIRQSPPLHADQPVRLPGDRSNRAKAFSEQAGFITLDDHLWETLCAMLKADQELRAH